jgi:hypothetical protein
MANTCTREICTNLIELMGRGYTQDQVCAEVKIHPDTFVEWRREGGPNYEKEFADAYKEAKVLQKAWWDRYGVDHMEDRNFQTGLYTLFRLNMRHWKGQGRSKEDELMEELSQIKKLLGMPQDDDD